MTLQRFAAFLQVCLLAAVIATFNATYATPVYDFIYYVLVVFTLAAPAISSLALWRRSRLVAALNASLCLDRLAILVLDLEALLSDLLAIYVLVLLFTLPWISIFVLLSEPRKQRNCIKWRAPDSPTTAKSQVRANHAPWLRHFSERCALVIGQFIYLGIELICRVEGKTAAARDTHVARIATRMYWKARDCERVGKLDDAYSVTQNAYDSLKCTDRNTTFTETVMLVGQLDRLGRAVGKVDVTRAALIETLEILQPIQADPERRSRELDEVVNWLNARLLDR